MSAAPCPDWRPMLHGLADDELDDEAARACRAHVAACAACATTLADIRALRARLSDPALRWSAPADLRRRIAETLAREGGRQANRIRPWAILDRLGRWSLLPAAAALAASLLLQITPPASDMALPRDIVAGHIRSLLADHLTDVTTSDQHTVKPWFSGRVDFAPPVIDLADRRFPLVGGRADYLDGRVVAALVYGHGGHVINLFIWPGAPEPDRALGIDGYSLYGWSRAGLTFWAVSDLDPTVLQEFRDDYAARAPK